MKFFNLSFIFSIIVIFSFGQAQDIIPFTDFNTSYGSWDIYATGGVTWVADPSGTGKVLKADGNDATQLYPNAGGVGLHNGLRAIFNTGALTLPLSGIFTDEVWIYVEGIAKKSNYANDEFLNSYSPVGFTEKGTTYAWGCYDVCVYERTYNGVNVNDFQHKGIVVTVINGRDAANLERNELVYWGTTGFLNTVNGFSPRIYLEANKWYHIVTVVDIDQDNATVYVNPGQADEKMGSVFAFADATGMQAGAQRDRWIGVYGGKPGVSINFDEITAYLGDYNPSHHVRSHTVGVKSNSWANIKNLYR